MRLSQIGLGPKCHLNRAVVSALLSDPVCRRCDQSERSKSRCLVWLVAATANWVVSRRTCHRITYPAVHGYNVISGVYDFVIVCVCVHDCLRSKRKTTWAMNTKLDQYTCRSWQPLAMMLRKWVHNWVTGQGHAPAWVCSLIWLQCWPTLHYPADSRIQTYTELVITMGPFYGAIAVPSVTRCRCRCHRCRGHRCAGGVRQ